MGRRMESTTHVSPRKHACQADRLTRAFAYIHEYMSRRIQLDTSTRGHVTRISTGTQVHLRGHLVYTDIHMRSRTQHLHTTHRVIPHTHQDTQHAWGVCTQKGAHKQRVTHADTRFQDTGASAHVRRVHGRVLCVPCVSARLHATWSMQCCSHVDDCTCL